MKIVEALKEVKNIPKKIQGNNARLVQYASKVSTEKPQFATEDDQRKEVKSLIQSNSDLVARAIDLRICIAYTNLMAEVEIDGVKWRIAQLLDIKRKYAASMLQTFDSLNESAAQLRLRTATHIDPTQRPQIERMYDEKEKNKNKDKWQSLYDNIDYRLEVINATTDLIIPDFLQGKV